MKVKIRQNNQGGISGITINEQYITKGSVLRVTSKADDDDNAEYSHELDNDLVVVLAIGNVEESLLIKLKLIQEDEVMTSFIDISELSDITLVEEEPKEEGDDDLDILRDACARVVLAIDSIKLTKERAKVESFYKEAIKGTPDEKCELTKEEIEGVGEFLDNLFKNVKKNG